MRTIGLTKSQNDSQKVMAAFHMRKALSVSQKTIIENNRVNKEPK